MHHSGQAQSGGGDGVFGRWGWGWGWGVERRWRGTRLLAMGLLLAALAIPCMGVFGLMPVSPAKAKELGIEFKTRPSGTDSISIDMEFPLDGVFKDFIRVDLEMTEPPPPTPPTPLPPLDGLKKGEEPRLLLSTALREDRSTPNRASVHVYAARDRLPQLKLRILARGPTMPVGYDVQLKDFVEVEKPKEPAATKNVGTPGEK